MDFDEALPTFIAEARELLDDMEDALLRIESDPENADLVNSIFRAAHTIKGSAGIFGLDHVVTFTHAAENLLDRVRDGSVPVTGELVATLLRAADHLKRLVDLLAAGTEADDEARSAGETLIVVLRQHIGAAPEAGAAQPPVPHVAHVERSEPEGASTDHWHLSLRFNADVTRNGLDPLSFIRYLRTFGRIAHIVTLTDAVPPLSGLEPESCYLGFEIAYETAADKSTIEGAFEFVKDDAHIRILPPHSRVSDYVRLIESLPNEELRLGEILIHCGTLTQKELESALRVQAQATVAEDATPKLGEVLVAQQSVRRQVVDAALDKQKQVKEHKSADAGLIRVNAEKLDQHINLIGELIIASAGAGVGAALTANPELLEAMTRMSRLVEQIRDSALGLRMVQIGATFHRFQRVVRDMSAELRKEIRLDIRGAETELDKTVVEKIGDPLMHLVRNSMDHGIERVEERVTRGKSAHGTVTLNAYHDSGSIVIEVADDGAASIAGRSSPRPSSAASSVPISSSRTRRSTP
jgi:two-component system chemotaxis sensor kinase CheA